jgi:hypothetical protein
MLRVVLRWEWGCPFAPNKERSHRHAPKFRGVRERTRSNPRGKLRVKVHLWLDGRLGNPQVFRFQRALFQLKCRCHMLIQIKAWAWHTVGRVLFDYGNRGFPNRPSSHRWTFTRSLPRGLDLVRSRTPRNFGAWRWLLSLFGANGHPHSQRRTTRSMSMAIR